MPTRVATVSFHQRQLNAFEDFAAAIQKHVQFAADWNVQLIVFPEYVTSSLLTLKMNWDVWTKPYCDLLNELAKKHKLYIHGGTHITKQKNHYYNTAYFVNPKGELATQHKVHLTPYEKQMGKLHATEELKVFNTPIGKAAMLTCYDIEFPEIVRAATIAGAEIILVPSFTDDRAGFHRVRYCSQARCIENQVYVIQAPLVGGISVSAFEQAVGKAGIFSPCDIGFPSDGVIAEGEFNQDLCIVADIDLEKLQEIRKNGTVTTFTDKRSVSDYKTEKIKF